MSHPSRRRKGAPATDPTHLGAEDHAAILAVVDEVRIDAGLGGQCGFVSEVLSAKFGWEMHGGIYHSDEGHPIGDHVWNYDPATDTIIDATADQFGEGPHTRILLPADPLTTRYRFAVSEEQEAEWLDAARLRTQQRGDYWWVEDGARNPNVVAYEALVAGYERGVDRHGNDPVD